jgi:hypothetical protein
MKEAGVTYVELVKRLKKHGFTETEGFNHYEVEARDVRRDILTGMPSGAGVRWCKIGGPLINWPFKNGY